MLLLVGFGLLPQAITGDDVARAAALRQVTEGVMPEYKFSIIQPVVSVPVHWVLRELGFGERAITTIPLLWLAGWSVVVWRLLSRHR
ncbi:MAG TPA: hypothetical protein VFV63_00235, partial [Ilumatobacteraceae bacterium]|nr:hypothetical protein [Ilumatobacteraceae bacterium]